MKTQRDSTALEVSLRNYFASHRSRMQGAGVSPRLLLAVSGGVDSMVLLDALNSCKDELSLELGVAHLNHGLREESVEEEQVVKRFATSLSLPYFTETASRFPEQENLEAWARAVRYEFLENVRAREGFDYILTAHHAGDQAETLLMRLVSGRLSSTLFTIAAFDQERRLLRPLLENTRHQIEQYAREYQVPFVHDPSNASRERTRNRFRHEVIPLLQEVSEREVIPQLAQVSARFNEDEQYLRASAKRESAKSGIRNGWQQLLSLPPALAWRVVRELAREDVGIEAEKLGFSSLSRLLQQAAASEISSTDLGFGIRLRSSAESEIRFEHAVTASPSFPALEASVGAGETVRWQYGDGFTGELRAETIPSSICSHREWLQRCASEQGSALASAAAYFDADTLPTRLEVAPRVKGETIRVFKRGQRKIKKLMQEKSLPHALRAELPILRMGEEVLWVPGVARGEGFELKENTRHILCIRYRREIDEGIA